MNTLQFGRTGNLLVLWVGIIIAGTCPAQTVKEPALTAEISISPARLAPGSTIEVVFPTAMVETAMTGKKADESPLLVEPELAGEFEWTSSRSGHYRLTQPPRFNQKYVFRLRAGLTDQAGASFDSAVLDTVSSDGFKILDQDPKWYGQNDVPRSRPFLFQFNDQVNPAEAAAHFTFKSSEPEQVIAARARYATGKDLRQFYADLQPTWAEEIGKVQPAPGNDEPRLSALVIEPAEPLPAAKQWDLLIAPDLANSAGQARLAEGSSVRVGAVLPMRVARVVGRTPFDKDYHLDIGFNKRLKEPPPQEGEDAAAIAARRAAWAAELMEQVVIEPAPASLSAEVSWEVLRLTGDFQLGTEYRVTVPPGFESWDGLKLEQPVAQTVTFEPNPPYVSAPAFARSQMTRGEGAFEISAANVRAVRVRAKRLNGPQLVEAREKYRPYLTAFQQNLEKRRAYKPVPIDDYPGEWAFDREFKIDKPLDRSELIRLNLRELLPAAGEGGALLLEMEGFAQDGLKDRGVLTQSLVETTDLGLMLKASGKDQLVFVTRLHDAAPVANARVTLLDGERKLLGHSETGPDGVARVSSANPVYVLAELGNDSTVIDTQRDHEMWSIYGYEIDRTWGDVWQPRRKTFIFSDRSLYRPGDTLHLKAMTRLLVGDSLTLDGREKEARLRMRDARYRLIHDEPVTFNANGSLTTDLVLPEGPLGGYNIEISFNREENADEDWNGGYYWFRVDDYRPNTFEVSIDTAKAALSDDQLQVPLSARYYMGKPLSQAEIQWHAFNSPGFDRPAEFADYHFGDAPAWAGYNSVSASYYYDDEAGGDWFVSGDLTLSPDGTALLPLPKPPPHRSAFPQIIEVNAEVTDLNQQTITTRASVRVPGAKILPGVRAADGFGMAGKEVALSLVAIEDNGKAARGTLSAEVLIERQEYQTTKVETAGGGTDTETTVVLHEERRETVALENGKAALAFTPAQGGSYFITVTTEDAEGTRAFSRLPFWVIGRGGYPWRIERGVRLTLQPEKKTVAPGGEAVINIQCPIEGTALVTVERNRVHQHFVRPYKLDDPLLRIPVGEADAPNIFVSVVVVRGAAASGKKHALPEFRAGYVEIEVPSDALALKVGISPDQAEVLPGSELGVSVRVTDARGAPLPGADVALFAVDEGVLSLTKHQTPNPSDFFHQLFPLAFSNHTSLDNLLAEEPNLRVRSNKGFLVGGGGDDEVIAEAMRKNFVATPLWLGSALTDGNGVVRATVPVPDNLTRYRLMSVVSAGAERFGSGESAFTVNKPLMLEPVVPRFARLGDEVLVKAILHNTTAQGREVELSLALDDGAALIAEARPFSPASDDSDTRNRKVKIALPAGASIATAFPVRFETTGETVWTWRARTADAGEALADATESRFQVEHPVPELREVHYARLGGASAAPADKKPNIPPAAKGKAAAPAKAAPKVYPPGPRNLLAQVKPAVLETQGAVKVSLTTSRLSELENALDYLLRYPYGCVEQTTSSTMPWLALGGYHSLFHGRLDPTKARSAIQHGASRLLQMVVEGEGGLAYWPGGTEPNRWGSAYGGLLLLRARESGAKVPDGVIKALCDYLSKNLRGLDKETDSYVVSDAALSLYTLAKAKRAEPAYHTLLYERRARLPEVAKLYLGLAMLISDAPHDQVKTLLGYGAADKSDGKPAAASFGHWAGPGVNQALRLLACTHMGLTQTADTLASEIWSARNLNGEWGNTYTNAWTLTALAAYDRSRKAPSGVPFEAVLAWGGEKQRLSLSSETPLVEVALPLSLERAAAPLTVELPEGAAAWVKTEVAGRPRARDFAGESHGFSIARDYRKVLPDGSTEPAENLRVGDLVQVSLGIELGGNDRYLAIEDPLPAVFEPMNPEYESQHARQDGPFDDYEAWFCDHRELRADRALFFTDHAPARGKFALHYLARVIAEGDTIAPPAKIEAMYEPSKYGLSPTQRVTTLPNPAAKVAER